MTTAPALTTVSTLMEDAVRQGIFPSGELLVARHGTIRHHQHVGTAQPTTIFDIASLTKPIGTALRCMQLTAVGQLTLDTPLGDLLPLTNGTAYAHVTVRHCLAHRAGFPAWRPFYERIASAEVGTRAARREILHAVLQESPIAAPGVRHGYSDLGFIVLGALLEQLDRRPLDQQFATEIAAPLQLTHTAFRPLPHSGYTVRHPAPDRDCAPTEDCPWRGRIVQGAVHDQNTYAMGGVAGHAGLFSTAPDLHRILATLDACWNGDSTWLPRTTLADFWRLDASQAAGGQSATDTTWRGTHRGGWDTPAATHSQYGSHHAIDTIGHLAFTGCSLCLDLTHRTWTILLTNRIHPTTTNDHIKTFRPRLHDAITTALNAETSS